MQDESPGYFGNIEEEQPRQKVKENVVHVSDGYLPVQERIPEKELEILNKMISPSSKTAVRGEYLLPFIEHFTQDLTTGNLSPEDKNYVEMLLDIAQNIQFIALQSGLTAENEMQFDLSEASNFFVNQAMTSLLASKSLNGFMVKQWRTQYGVSESTSKQYFKQGQDKGRGWLRNPFKQNKTE